MALNAGNEPDEDVAGPGIDDKLIFSVGTGERDIPELGSVDLIHLDPGNGNAFFMLSFLEMNGIRLQCTDDELVDIGLSVASGRMRYEELLQWVLDHKA